MITMFHNVGCMKCQCIELEMRMVGCMVFCKKCTDEEFSTEHPPTEERPKYLKWLKVYEKQVQ